MALSLASSTFSQTKMIINKTNGTTDSLKLSEIKSITFKTYSSSIPMIGLVAYYPFNGNANDSSGNGHDGTVSGASLTSNRFGQPNSAYNFNGTDASISIPHSPVFDYSGSDTIAFSLWANLSANQIDLGWVGFICKSSLGGVSNYCITRSPGDSLCNAIINHFGSNDYISSLSPLLPNQWYHLFVSFAQKTCSIYVNGVYNSSKTFSPTPILNTAPLYIGDDTDGGHNYYTGIIDDIRIYRRSLSEAEISMLYHENGW